MALSHKLVDLRSRRFSGFRSTAVLLIPAALAIWSVMASQPNFEYSDGGNGAPDRAMFESPVCTQHCDDDDHHNGSTNDVQPTATSETGSHAIVLPTANRNANLRAGPGLNYRIVGHVNARQTLQLVGKNPGGQWYRLVSGAWIAASLVDNAPDLPYYTGLTDSVSPASPAQQQSLQPTANRNANLRAGPGYSYAIIGHVSAGQALKVVAKSVDGRWYHLESGEWIAVFLVDNAPELP